MLRPGLGLDGGVLAAVLVALTVARRAKGSWSGGLTGRRWIGGSNAAPHHRAGGARWADRRDLRPLVVTGRAPGRLFLGVTAGPGRRSRRLLLAAEPSQSLAVIGPTQSGKTSALAVPAILAWEGPVVAASVKADLLRDTWGWRSWCGRVWCVDPTGSTGRPPSTWSPLARARTWPGARRAAADLTEAGRSEGTSADGEFWMATATKLLAPLLFAAATGGRSMADVVRWVDTQEMGEVVGLLESTGIEEALQAAQATWQRDDRQRSSVYTTAETILEPFAEGSGPPAATDPVDVEGLLDGSHTLYLCAPAHDQRRLRGVFTAAVKDVLQTAFARAGAGGTPLDPPLLVVLDEAANIAPLAELDGLAATCAGHGVQLLTVWQDLAQISARYGARAATVLNNHRARLFLSGIADPSTLDHASHLVGDEELVLRSETRDPTGGVSSTRGTSRRRLLAPEALRCMAPSTGVLVYGSLPAARVRLRPWWDDAGLAARARGGSRSE